MSTMLTTALEGMSFDDKCRLIGVAPLDSGVCVDTAAGPNGAVVLTDTKVSKPHPRKPTMTHPSVAPSADELYARTLQKEKDASATSAADAVCYR